MKTKKEKATYQNQQQKLEVIQTLLDKFLSTDEGEQLRKREEEPTQTELAKILNMTQPNLSRAMSGHEIDWESGKIVKKIDSLDLVQLTKGVHISHPSSFFLTVPRTRRKQLKDALELAFPSTKETYGIIKIFETTSPSGLLIFSDDHNLEYHLMDDEYLSTLLKPEK